MGVNAWFAAYYTDDPREVLAKDIDINRAGSLALAQKLLPDAGLEEKEDGTLDELNPGRKEVYVGDYGGLKIIAHQDLGVDFLSRIAPVGTIQNWDRRLSFTQRIRL